MDEQPGFLRAACVFRTFFRGSHGSGWYYRSEGLFGSRAAFVHSLFSGKFPEQVFSSKRVVEVHPP